MTATALRLFIASIIGAFLVIRFDVNLTTLLSGVSDWYFIALAAAIPVTISSLISVNRWQIFLRLNGINERLATLWKITLVSQFQGLILPSSQGSDAFRIFYIEQRNPQKRGVAGSTVIIERMIGLLVLCTTTLTALQFLPAGNDYFPLFILVAIISAAALLAQYILVSERIHRCYGGFQSRYLVVQKIIAYIEKLHAGAVHFPYRKALLPSILLITLYQGSIISVVYLVFRAYGYEIPFIQHAAIYPIIAILTLVPITIGGLGVREGFFVYFYSMIGVPAHIAIGVSLVNYTLIALVPAVFGALVYLKGGFREKPENKPAE